MRVRHQSRRFDAVAEIVEAAAASRIAANAAALSRTHKETLSHLRLSGPDAAEFAASAGALDLLLDALQVSGAGSPAATLLEKAAEQAPEGSEVRFSASASLLDLGYDSDRRGDHSQALALYRAAVNAWPDSVSVRLKLGISLAEQGEVSEAEAQLWQVLRLNPDSGSAHQLLGKLLQTTDARAAAAQYREALRIAPGLPEVHHALGATLQSLGQADDALGEFREAMRLQPGWAAPLADAALLLALNPDPKSRDPEEAIRLASQALRLTGPRNTDVLEILAAAYAAAGQYGEAVSAQRKAADLAAASGDKERAAQAEGMLDQYRHSLSRR